MTTRSKVLTGTVLLAAVLALAYWQRYVLFILVLALFPPRAPLHEAAYRGDMDTVRMLVAAQPDWIDELRSFQMDQRLTTLSPLMWAARGGHLDIARELVHRGADPQLRDGFGRTALWFACREGHTEIAAYLIEETGADPKLTSKFVSPLNAAAINGHTETVRLLIKHGAHSDEILRLAIIEQDLAMVKVMLEAGAAPSPVVRIELRIHLSQLEPRTDEIREIIALLDRTAKRTTTDE